MASILKRKNKYSVIYSFIDEQGEKRQKWETWGTVKEAKKRKAEIELKQANGSFVRPTLKTVSDLMYDFVELYGISKWALSTFTAKKSLIDNYINPIIGDMKLSEITPRMMDGYYKKLLKVKRADRSGTGQADEYVSPRNILEVHKVLNCAFNQAVRWECMEHNPAAKASLPHYEKKTRAIWTADDLFHALDVCEDERLSLAINLAFSCSLRLGEMMGLTWDCVDISEQSIIDNNASIYVEKELLRVSKDALQKLENRDVLKIFPAVFSANTTALVLKKPKTQTSIRRIWLPKTVAEMLVAWEAQQNEMKEYLGCEYLDFGMVIAQPNGRPLEGQIISRAFSELIREHGLPDVVFHSLRHSSTTYKLKLNNGDMKAVQGDTGHAQLKMVSDVYSHILDEDRKNNAAKFEEAFYHRDDAPDAPEHDPANAAVVPFETPKKKTETIPSDDATKLIELLNNSPELAAELLRMVSQSNGSTRTSISND